MQTAAADPEAVRHVTIVGGGAAGWSAAAAMAAMIEDCPRRDALLEAMDPR